MDKLDGEGQKGSLPPTGSGAALSRPPPVPPSATTNSWARRVILARAHMLSLPPAMAGQVGSVALWYYNRIVVLRTTKDAKSPELPPDTNKYLVPVTLALACTHKGVAVGLDQLLRMAGNPTRRTVEIAHEWYAAYAQVLTPARGAARRESPPRKTAPGRAVPVVPPASASEYRLRGTGPIRPPPSGPSRPASARPSGATRAPAVVTVLAVPATPEIRSIRSMLEVHKASGKTPPPSAKPKQPSTNAWARKRIGDLSKRLGLPESVKSRALGFYDQILALHSRKTGLPAGRTAQLSPRLNWSLVFTTIYLGCRYEEYPKDLRDILGRDPPRGLIREMYGLYRFYKRELKVPIKMVDVKTFILSWFDGFEISELVQEKAASFETERLKKRALAIASRARAERTLQGTTTKIIAAGALTTALAERNPQGSRNSFYKAIADFLHMSEETIRYIVARIAEIL